MINKKQLMQTMNEFISVKDADDEEYKSIINKLRDKSESGSSSDVNNVLLDGPQSSTAMQEMYDRREKNGHPVFNHLGTLPTHLLRDMIAAYYATEECGYQSVEKGTFLKSFQGYCQIIDRWPRDHIVSKLVEKATKFMRYAYQNLALCLPRDYQ